MNSFVLNTTKSSPHISSKTKSSQTTAITSLFPKIYFFFKSASDVSGVELLHLEYMKAHRNAYGERMTEAQEQQLERRLAKLCEMD